jgi:hypothetical protein
MSIKSKAGRDKYKKKKDSFYFPVTVTVYGLFFLYN